MTSKRPHEYYEVLLMKVADFHAIKETTDMMTRRILMDAKIEPPREGTYARLTLKVGFLLLLVGALILSGFAAYSLFTDPTVPLVVKLGGSAAGLGALVLLVYVLRIRWRARSKDPYKEIDL